MSTVEIHKCELCVNWEVSLACEPCHSCTESRIMNGVKTGFTPQAFQFDDLGTDAKLRVMRETRSNIADEEGTCKDTDEQLIQYIRESGHIYMKDGEVIE